MDYEPEEIPIARKIVDFLERHKGQYITAKQMMSDLNLRDNSADAGRAKLYEMVRKGQVIRTQKKGYFLISDQFEDVIGSKPGPKKGSKHKSTRKKVTRKQEAKVNGEKHIPMLTPEARFNLERLQEIKNVEPLDMGNIMQHLTNINEQNKMLRMALEQISHILAQCGIIE